MNRSKAKGTAAESAVVKWAKDNGYPDARRLALAGNGDVGDVELTRNLMLQVKAGKAAEIASDNQIETWLVVTEAQAQRGGYRECYLITKRAGKGQAKDWWVHTYKWMVPVRFTLGHLPLWAHESAI